jgi:hypothetical protein
VDDALGDALMIEMEDLLAQNEILQQRRAARARLEAVLVVADRYAMIGRKDRSGIVGALVRLAAVAGVALALIDHKNPLVAVTSAWLRGITCRPRGVSRREPRKSLKRIFRAAACRNA